MTDDTERYDEFACDLFSSRAMEPALSELLGNRPVGEWVSVRELCTFIEDFAPPTHTLSATWLPSPGNPYADYAIILLADPESGWTNTAVYNSGRLLATITKEFQAVA